MPDESPEQAPAVPTHPVTAQPTNTPTQPAPTAQPTQPQATTQPAAPIALFQQPTVTTEPQTLREKLNAGDSHWQWKIGFRVVLILLGIIGIGCAAWTFVHFGPEKQPYEYELDDTWAMPWTLITFSVSVIWSFVCVLVFFVRRPNAPVHPGAQVGMDLVLWLAFIPTGLFAILAVSSVASLGSGGRIGDSWYSSSSDGYYIYSASNNTWNWDPPSSNSWSSSGGYIRGCSRNLASSSNYYSGIRFSNCTEEDIFVNGLWTGKNQRFNTELTATVCQFFMLLLHLVLFIWACVDTNRRNSRKVGKDAEKMAAEIVMKMVQAGAIIPAPGAAHMRPMPGHIPPQMMQQGQIPPHLMQQMFPQQHTQQYQQLYGHFAPQPVPATPAPQQPMTAPGPAVASSSNEKGAGPRFV